MSIKATTRTRLTTEHGGYTYYSLPTLIDHGYDTVTRLPYSIKVLLESALRNADGTTVSEDDISRLAGWDPNDPSPKEIPFIPSRVLLQDFTGVPAVVDLAALRDACQRLGADPERINPLVLCHLVIDHSVQVDYYGRPNALRLNTEKEFERNHERYELLKWGQEAFESFAVVPPATGIVHQVNLEYLASVVTERDGTVFPDSLVGTDSHTTMINGLGVVGWGVGGIEAEAVMLGQPIYMLLPKVVGFKLNGSLRDGVTATDLVLTVTEILRKTGVVGQFVEYFGPGLAKLSLPDRATIANMSPEYGATVGFFPVDQVTLDYLRFTGRSEESVELVERYCKEQGLWREEGTEPIYSRIMELDLSTVEVSIAGPRRPQDRIALRSMKEQWGTDLADVFGKTQSDARVEVAHDGSQFTLHDGAVVIAAITSCTNTSNPSIMIGAGLLARVAVEKGLSVPPWVKTSLAPGSRVVTEYLDKAGLTPYLDELGFNVVGYGCTTCIGNSGPLSKPIRSAIRDNGLVVASVLSGNRNFEGRINTDTRASYLASPPLVVAYALAGRIDIDFETEPIGTGNDGEALFLKDIWPSSEVIHETVQTAVNPDQFVTRYANVFAGPEEWQSIDVPGGQLYEWDPESTYVRRPPFFDTLTREIPPSEPIENARALAVLADSVTTDHISPAGTIPVDSPAGQYLLSRGVMQKEFNSFGSRRGNHEVMMRGTFGNVRLRNLLIPGTEGGVTIHIPSGKQMSIYDAALRYRAEGTPLVVLAGKEYGAGSSRDWAAKGTNLLGIRAVLAASFERIHRSNLVGMGVLPLQFKDGESMETLSITGHERFDIDLPEELESSQEILVRATDDAGDVTEFSVISRIDTQVEVEYYKNGGILHTVLRRLISS